MHVISSYKKRWEILTNFVSYFLAIFLQFLFLIFSTLYGLCYLFFHGFTVVS